MAHEHADGVPRTDHLPGRVIRSTPSRRGQSAAYADCMIRLRFFVLVFGLSALAFSSLCQAQTGFPANSVTLTPAVAEVGSPELIRVSLPSAQEVSGEWMGQKIAFFQDERRRNWFALAGVDVAAKIGASTLRLAAKMRDGEKHLDIPVEIHAAKYRTETIRVAPRFVEPNPQDLKLIEADSRLKAKVFAESSPERLWRGNFRVPVMSPSTDSFGVRRTYNGKLDSIHKGMDFRARTGTPVRAGNSGVVVLAQKLYFEGNCVVIDHGFGIYSISMHLSRIDVHDGEHVDTGQQLGLSGATGRVTGPHLHWAVRWQGAYLDPAKLLHLDLAAIH